MTWTCYEHQPYNEGQEKIVCGGGACRKVKSIACGCYAFGLYLFQTLRFTFEMAIGILYVGICLVTVHMIRGAFVDLLTRKILKNVISG